MKTKEERFLELIGDLYTGDYSIEVTLDKTLKIITFYNSKNEWLIKHDQKNGYTCIKWSLIWLVFEKEYDMKYNDIESFMKDMLLTNLKIEGTTPRTSYCRIFKELLTNLKIEGTTPSPITSILLS